MSSIQFPTNEYWKILESPESWNGGGVSFPDIQQLQSIKATILKIGTHAGTEQFRLAFYNDAALTSLYSASNWLSLAEIEAANGGPLTAQWRGVVRFDFNPDFVEPGRPYYIAVESQNYNRNALVFYVAWALDWPFPVNTQSGSPVAGLRMEIYNQRMLGFA